MESPYSPPAAEIREAKPRRLVPEVFRWVFFVLDLIGLLPVVWAGVFFTFMYSVFEDLTNEGSKTLLASLAAVGLIGATAWALWRRKPWAWIPQLGIAVFAVAPIITFVRSVITMMSGTAPRQP